MMLDAAHSVRPLTPVGHRDGMEDGHRNQLDSLPVPLSITTPTTTTTESLAFQLESYGCVPPHDSRLLKILPDGLPLFEPTALELDEEEEEQPKERQRIRAQDGEQIAALEDVDATNRMLLKAEKRLKRINDERNVFRHRVEKFFVVMEREIRERNTILDPVLRNRPIWKNAEAGKGQALKEIVNLNEIFKLSNSPPGVAKQLQVVPSVKLPSKEQEWLSLVMLMNRRQQLCRDWLETTKDTIKDIQRSTAEQRHFLRVLREIRSYWRVQKKPYAMHVYEKGDDYPYRAEVRIQLLSIPSSCWGYDKPRLWLSSSSLVPPPPYSLWPPLPAVPPTAPATADLYFTSGSKRRKSGTPGQRCDEAQQQQRAVGVSGQHRHDAVVEESAPLKVQIRWIADASHCLESERVLEVKIVPVAVRSWDTVENVERRTTKKTRDDDTAAASTDGSGRQQRSEQMNDDEEDQHPVESLGTSQMHDSAPPASPTTATPTTHDHQHPTRSDSSYQHQDKRNSPSDCHQVDANQHEHFETGGDFQGFTPHHGRAVNLVPRPVGEGERWTVDAFQLHHRLQTAQWCLVDRAIHLIWQAQAARLKDVLDIASFGNTEDCASAGSILQEFEAFRQSLAITIPTLPKDSVSATPLPPPLPPTATTTTAATTTATTAAATTTTTTTTTQQPSHADEGDSARVTQSSSPSSQSLPSPSPTIYLSREVTVERWETYMTSLSVRNVPIFSPIDPSSASTPAAKFRVDFEIWVNYLPRASRSSPLCVPPSSSSSSFSELSPCSQTRTPRDPHSHSRDPHSHSRDPHSHSRDPHSHSRDPHSHSRDPHYAYLVEFLRRLPFLEALAVCYLRQQFLQAWKTTVDEVPKLCFDLYPSTARSSLSGTGAGASLFLDFIDWIQTYLATRMFTKFPNILNSI